MERWYAEKTTVEKYPEEAEECGSTSIQTVFVELLKEKGLTVSSAESFTGGLISKLITDVSGASSVFSLGACTYSNEAKAKILGVREETLETYGAVSKETAAEMAEGIRAVSGADIGISTTGVAGPEPSEGKPVGKVFIGVSYGMVTKVQELMLGEKTSADRTWIRKTGADYALRMAKEAAETWKADGKQQD